MSELAVTAGKEYLLDIVRQIEDHRKSIDAALATLDGLIHRPEAKFWLAKIRTARAEYAASCARVLEQIDAGKKSEALCLMQAETVPALEALHAPILGLLEAQKTGVSGADPEAQQGIDSALTLMAVLKGAPSAVWQASAGEDA